MKQIGKLINNVKNNLAEYYTLASIVVALPLIVALLTDVRWGLLLSFTAQSIIGILYIKGKK